MPEVNIPAHKTGDFLVDYEEKVFPDIQAEPGEKALVTFHTVAFEGSIGLVNLLQATRLKKKGFETSILLYGPGVTLGLQRGFPKLGGGCCGCGPVFLRGCLKRPSCQSLGRAGLLGAPDVCARAIDRSTPEMCSRYRCDSTRDGGGVHRRRFPARNDFLDYL